MSREGQEAGVRKMHRPGVSKESAIIFNCSFESSESGKIGKLFVENGL
jgi:hypothetical protein